jgi:DNA-binding transcriptional MocR family regulator
MPDGHRVAAATLSRLLDGWATTQDETLYLRLAEAMTDLIRSNTLPDGTILPSQRSLAEALGIARGTVTRVYETLAAKELIEARQGTGSRIRSRGVAHALGDARLVTYTGHHGTEIDLTSGALPGLPTVADAFGRLDRSRLVAEVATDGYHPKGMQVLREAVADRYTREGLPTEPDQILITSGAQHAVWLIAHALVSRGDEVIVEEPTYRGALEAFRHAGAQLVSVPVREHGIDLDHLRRRLEHRPPRLLYCQPSVHNPTGIALSRARHRQLAELTARFGVTVVDDTSFADLTLDKEAVPPPLPGAMLVGTASKLFWGGLRVGWVRTTPELVDRLVGLRRAADLATPVADQLVTADLLASAEEARAARATHLLACLAATEALLRDRRPDWSWQRPSGGTGLWIDTGANAVTLVEHARRQGVRLVAGPAFSAFNGFAQHVRLPYWRPTATVAEALDRI